MVIDRNKLFFDCKSQHKSFHEWPRWINSTLTRIMLNEKYNNEKDMKKSMRESVKI